MDSDLDNLAILSAGPPLTASTHAGTLTQTSSKKFQPFRMRNEEFIGISLKSTADNPYTNYKEVTEEMPTLNKCENVKFDHEEQEAHTDIRASIPENDEDFGEMPQRHATEGDGQQPKQRPKTRKSNVDDPLETMVLVIFVVIVVIVVNIVILSQFKSTKNKKCHIL